MSEDVELMLTAEARELEAENRRLLGVLNRNGFRKCDIAACNCGSWHAGPNLRAEKAEEVQLVQEERARELIAESEAESDSLRAELAAMKAQRDAMVAEILSDDYPPPLEFEFPERTHEASFSGGDCSKHGRYYGSCASCANDYARARARARHEQEWQWAKRDRLKALAREVTP